MRALPTTLIVALLAAAAAAQPTFTETQRLVAPDGANGDRFGQEFAVDGNTLAVGASYHNSGSGAVYVFEESGGTWTQVQKLLPPGAGGQFGYSIELEGDTMVVGAFVDDTAGTDAGAAYVYERSGGTWSLAQTLTASDATPGDWFGSVALDGDTLIVGAGRRSSNTGIAYVFQRSGGTWTETQQLTPSSPSAQERFGYNISLDGGTLAIAAFSYAGFRGRVIMFEESGGTWSESQVLVASDGVGGGSGGGDYFGGGDSSAGSGVELEGDTLLVGASRGDDAGTNYGEIYEFTRSGGVWTESSTKLLPPAVDLLFSGASLQGDYALCSGRGDANAGSINLFERVGGMWGQVVTVTGSTQDAGDLTTSAILDGSRAFVGAWRDEVAGAGEAGAVFVFATSLGAPAMPASTPATRPWLALVLGALIAAGSWLGTRR